MHVAKDLFQKEKKKDISSSGWDKIEAIALFFVILALVKDVVPVFRPAPYSVKIAGIFFLS